MAKTPKKTAIPKRRSNKFHLDLLNGAQQLAYAAYQQHDVLFLTGPAGTGKTHLAMAFAINDVLTKQKSKIILTRPVVESGEKLGFLPGDLQEKVDPYMRPLHDVMDKLVKDEAQREIIENAAETSPIAYMRGRTFENAVCIFDEGQNATKKQLKLFMSRFDEDSKLILTGDPLQSDLDMPSVEFTEVVRRLESLKGIATIKFNNSNIVRHPLVGAIMERLEE